MIQSVGVIRTSVKGLCATGVIKGESVSEAHSNKLPKSTQRITFMFQLMERM